MQPGESDGQDYEESKEEDLTDLPTAIAYAAH